MKKITRKFKSLVRREEGASMVEYGLLVALIAVAIVATVTLLGSTIADTFSSIVTSLGGSSS